jgi:hypothetical protein
VSWEISKALKRVGKKVVLKDEQMVEHWDVKKAAKKVG